MKKAPSTTTKATAPGARDTAHFICKLLASVNAHACRLIDRAVGNDPRKLLDLLAVTGFAAGAAFALALVGVLQ